MCVGYIFLNVRKHICILSVVKFMKNHSFFIFFFILCVFLIERIFFSVVYKDRNQHQIKSHVQFSQSLVGVCSVPFTNLLFIQSWKDAHRKLFSTWRVSYAWVGYIAYAFFKSRVMWNWVDSICESCSCILGIVKAKSVTVTCHDYRWCDSHFPSWCYFSARASSHRNNR